MTTPRLDDVLSREDPPFAAAVRAVVTGDADALGGRLAEQPDLARRRSSSAHRATLLHYVASNGIEDALQLDPTSVYQRLAACPPPERPVLAHRALDVPRRLLDAGANADATCETYGGGPAQTTLNLLVSSDHPRAGGVQADLVRILCAGGANPNGLDDSGSPLATALAFGGIEAAHALTDAGARVDNLVFAAALDRRDCLEAYFPGNRLADDVGACDLGWFAVAPDAATAAEQALVFAALAGAVDAMTYLLDRGVDVDANPPGSHWTATALHAAAATGRADVTRILVERGADPTIVEPRYEATALGWAEHAGADEVADLLRGHLARWPS